MKKTLSLVLALVMAIACMSFVATAAPSPEISGVITGIITSKDSEGNTITTNLNNKNGKRNPEIDKKLEDVNKGDTKYQIVDTKVITADNGIKYPITVDLTVLGVTANSKGVILLVKENGEVVELTPVFSNNKVTVTLECAGEFSLAVDSNTAAAIVEGNKNGTSQETSDSVTPVAISLVLVFALVAGYSFKKIKA